MSDEQRSDPTVTPDGQRRSPIRPVYAAAAPAPEDEPPPAPAPPPASAAASNGAAAADNPQAALNTLRRKIDILVDEFAAGRINRAQFHALYSRYNEQRSIIQRLLERNPDSDAWKQVVTSRGQTGFLRANLTAQSLTVAIFLRGETAPVQMLGRRPLDPATALPLLLGLWHAQQPVTGLGRKALAHGEWLLCAVGEQAATLVVYSLEPSISQARLVRDLHGDFERANRLTIARGAAQADRLVYPQRALIEPADR